MSRTMFSSPAAAGTLIVSAVVRRNENPLDGVVGEGGGACGGFLDVPGHPQIPQPQVPGHREDGRDLFRRFAAGRRGGGRLRRCVAQPAPQVFDRRPVEALCQFAVFRADHLRQRARQGRGITRQPASGDRHEYLI